MNSSIEEKFNTEISFCKTQIEKYQSERKSIFASSSFQSHSIPMLHLLSEIDKSIPIYFIDTGFHFPETILYRNQIAELLNLNLKITKSEVPKLNQIGNDNRFLFSSNPDFCCHINKVEPMNIVAKEYDVWITGVRKNQNSNRAQFGYEAKGANGIIRFHPMLNWDDKMINTYLYKNSIPPHPLEAEGYKSIGCAPCTGKPIFDKRSGRWQGMHKTECGLHLGVK